MALALLNTQQHARAVDIRDLQVGHLRDAQTSAIGHAEGGLVLRAQRLLRSIMSSIMRARSGLTAFEVVGVVPRLE